MNMNFMNINGLPHHGHLLLLLECQFFISPPSRTNIDWYDPKDDEKVWILKYIAGHYNRHDSIHERFSSILIIIGLKYY